VTTPPPVKQTPEVVEPNPQTPEGQGATGGGPAVATLVSTVKAPNTIPAQISATTSMQAVAPDLTATCNLLKTTFQAVCTTKDAGSKIQVTLSVAADKADATQAQITALLGGGVTANTVSVNRAPQVQSAFERVATLSEDLTKLEQQVATTKDAQQKAVVQAQLDQKRIDGQAAVADYNRLLDEINSRLFVIDLQKQGQ
jgi:hypothetical protein